jgi:hypothetical protein
LEQEALDEANEKAYSDEQMAKTKAQKDELDADLAKLTSKINQAASGRSYFHQLGFGALDLVVANFKDSAHFQLWKEVGRKRRQLQEATIQFCSGAMAQL